MRILNGRDPVFYLSVLLLAAASLWPIWYYRFLPMQDYPQHLFISFVIATFDNPGYDWNQHYQTDLHLGPYSLQFLVMRLLMFFVQVETAGKLLVSFYVLLTTVTVLHLSRQFSPGHTPWALLLMFPLLFNQIYFLGFQSFLLSLPLLLLALADFENITAQPLTRARSLRHGVYQAVLFLCHPYTALVYLIFTAVLALCLYQERVRFKRALWLIVLISVVLLWGLSQLSTAAATQHLQWSAWWGPVEWLWHFYLLMFTGMRINNGIDWLSAGLWIVAGGALLFGRTGSGMKFFYRKEMIWLVLSLAGYMLLPFLYGYYAYFNVRLAPISYLLLVLLLATVKLPRMAAYTLAVCSLLLVVLNISLHDKLSAETADILPLLQKMEKNAPVFPLYIDSHAAAIDPVVFYGFHTHDHNYYHLLIGGGANPSLFPNPMLPLHFRSDIQMPYPPPIASKRIILDWEIYRPYYRYILARGQDPALLRYLAQHTTLIAQSATWSLFENPHAAIKSTPPRDK